MSYNLEIEVVYGDLSSQKQTLANIDLLQKTDVQYIILWRDTMILRESDSFDYYYIVWEDTGVPENDWIILEGYMENDADKVFHQRDEANLLVNREYLNFIEETVNCCTNSVIFTGALSNRWDSTIKDIVAALKAQAVYQ
jgi:hypothetical protein